MHIYCSTRSNPGSPRRGFVSSVLHYAIALDLDRIHIERSAKEIYQHLHRLESELGKFSELFDTFGNQLNNAKNNYDKADKQLSTFSDKLKSIQSLPESPSPKQIDAF